MLTSEQIADFSERLRATQSVFERVTIIRDIERAALAAQSEPKVLTGFDVALNALDEYQRNWDTGLTAEYAQSERIQMECACEAVREAMLAEHGAEALGYVSKGWAADRKGTATISAMMTDAARDTKDAKRYRLLRERHFVRADNPNVSVYHCVGVFTSWLRAPTIDREGLDAVLDAEIERIDRA